MRMEREGIDYWCLLGVYFAEDYINLATKTVPAFDKGLTPYTDWK
jgi:hypothetical protein